MNVTTPSFRESSAVLSVLESSTRILISTMSESSRTVLSKVSSALYAGITTAIRFPFITIPTPANPNASSISRDSRARASTTLPQDLAEVDGHGFQIKGSGHRQCTPEEKKLRAKALPLD